VHQQVKECIVTTVIIVRFSLLLGYVSSIGCRRFIPFVFILLVSVLLLISTRYYSRSLTLSWHIAKSGSNSTHLTSSTTSNATEQATRLIVISHFNEDLDWLDIFIGERIPHIVYTRSTDRLALHGLSTNKGREAVVYLRYIVDHYANLPSLIAFIHAHRTSWHQKDPPDIVIALRALQWNKYAYMPLTSAMTQAMFTANATDEQTRVNSQLWRDVLQGELGQPPIQATRSPCCATFVVRRNAILAHSKAFYLNIHNYILASTHSDQLTGRTLEYTWHMIFGQPARVQYQTCDLFMCDAQGKPSVELAAKMTA
jgi:hypothetical protein